MPGDDLPVWLQRRRWEVGARLRKLRHERGLSQIQLGELAGIDNKSISRYENGHRNMGIDDLFRLADALGVPADRLLRGDE